MVDLVDFIFEGFRTLIEWFTARFTEGIVTGYDTFTAATFGTPTPETRGNFVFGDPVNAPWPDLQEALVGGEITLIALLVLVVAVQGRHTIRIFNVGSGYQAHKTSKTAWVGVVLIVTWYWVSVLVLYLVDGFTLALMPSVDTLLSGLASYLTVSVRNPALGLLLAALGGTSMWALQALFFLRRLLLFIYLYAMPIGIALAFGNVPVLSAIAMRFCQQFIPLAVLPLPAALVFKGYDFLYGSGALAPESNFLQYFMAASLPVVMLYVTWKTFGYASPLASRAIASATTGAVTVGAIAGGAYLAGPRIATTAALWGPKAAAGHAMAEGTSQHQSRSQQRPTEAATYRRTENEPDWRYT